MSESTPIQAGAQPFTTTDAELALSLITAGCQFAQGADGGPAQQHWTPEVCRNRWVTHTDPNTKEKRRVTLLPQGGVSPENFERAVMRAVKLKIPGIVTFYILRDSVFREAIAAHDAMVKVFADAARDKAAPALPNLATMTEAAMIMTVLYIRRANEQNVKDHAWLRSPNLCLGEARKKVTPREGVDGAVLEQVSYTASADGSKIWSLDLPDDKRATIMSDGKPFIHPKPR